MISFFVTLAKLFSAIWEGRKDPEFRVLFQFLLILLVAGVFFYTQAEGWSVIDALYFSVITMATIGYGDLAPHTTVGKVFTMFYALISVGVFVAVAAKIGAILLEKKQQQERQRADKRGSGSPEEGAP